MVASKRLLTIALLLVTATCGCAGRGSQRFARRSPAEKPGVLSLSQSEHGPPDRRSPARPAARAPLHPPATNRAHPGAALARQAPRPAYLEQNITMVGGGQQEVVAVSGPTFDDLIANSELPVMVDCWAPWCGPCKRMLPTVDELSDDFAGRAVVAKLNIDADPAVKQRYAINSIPAFLFFKDGQLVDRVQGAVPKAELERRLAALAPNVQTVRRDAPIAEEYAADFAPDETAGDWTSEAASEPASEWTSDAPSESEANPFAEFAR